MFACSSARSLAFPAPRGPKPDRRYPGSQEAQLSRSFELDPVDGLAVGTVGPPGRRQFFLRASGGGEEIVLNCEKVHVQGLIAAIRQRLGAKPEATTRSGRPAPAAEPGEAAWTIGELGLGYHESRSLFVIVAREAPVDEEAEAQELATARFWASADLIDSFSMQAEAVVAAGRPACPHCGLPVDPRGHPCPAANGSRPVL